MQCRYCQASNHDEEHRCVRCGRRLYALNARSTPELQPIQTATAPDLMEYSQQAVETVPAEPEQSRVVYQRPLFRELKQVIQIPSLRSSVTRETMKPARRSRPRTAHKVHAAQRALDFTSSRATAGVDAGIYCDAPVASLMHRTVAVALDSSMILIALGVFAITFQLAGGVIVLNLHTAPVFAGVAAVLGFLYHFLFCIADGDTPGMRWTDLQLLNFDGQRPDRQQRASRLTANCLSVLAAGLGVFWALVDEEKLTWHDHMSRTFPSPRGQMLESVTD